MLGAHPDQKACFDRLASASVAHRVDDHESGERIVHARIRESHPSLEPPVGTRIGQGDLPRRVEVNEDFSASLAERRPAALEDRLAKAERLPTDIIRRDQLRSVEDREHLAFKSGDPRLGIVVERSARLNLDEDRVVAGVPLRKIANGLETIGEERAVRLVVRLGDMLDAIAFEEGIVDQIELESAHALLLELNEDGGMIVTPID